MLERVGEAAVLDLQADGLVHEGGERIAALVGHERAVASGHEWLQHRLQDGDDQVVLGRKVAIEGRDVHAGVIRDGVHAHAEPLLAEGARRRLDQPGPVAGGVLAGRSPDGGVGHPLNHNAAMTAVCGTLPFSKRSYHFA